MDPIAIEGAKPSAELRQELADAGAPVMLAFSRGKDSIAAWLALRDAGIKVIPYHLYLIPGLRFVEDSLAYYAGTFGCEIIDLPHPSLYRWLAHATFQTPDRVRILEAAQLAVPTYDDIHALIREQLNLPATTWTCDGVRAADSPNRRTSIVTRGPLNQTRRTAKIVWDWRKAHVMDAIRTAGVRLPADYEWFGRSFDGLDRRFLQPLKQHAPDDYARVLQWFPLADLELSRAGL